MNEGDNSTVKLGEAATSFLLGLAKEKKEASQQEVYNFVRFYGWERTFTELSAHDIARYAECLSSSDTEYAGKLELVRSFLAFARKKGWSRTNLAAHLKARKGKSPARNSSMPNSGPVVSLTEEGYAEMKKALATLKKRRVESIEEVRSAAADKDFRENAPLDAAKEQRSYIEGQIRELEEALKSAVIIDRKREAVLKAAVGDSVVLKNVTSGAEMQYMLVAPSEVDPSRGRISTASPIGKAVIGRSQGEVVEVLAPSGRISYEIKIIER
ncbi:MAG: transcription elongation factor GreA [Dehalococcoidales bacterium]